LKDALEGADDEQIAAYHKGLTAEESQALILQSVEKKRKREERRQQEHEALRKKYIELVKQRVSSEEITSVTVTASYDKKAVKVDLRRKNVSQTQTFPNIHEKDLGVTEWVELNQLIANKTSPAANLLKEMLAKYFIKISTIEAKLGVTRSILKVSPAEKAQTFKPSVSKKRKEKPTDEEQPIEMLINTNLPIGVPVGYHGEVIKAPEVGMFYDTLHGGRRFYRAEDMNLSSSEFLIKMYNICKHTSNDPIFMQMLIDEMKNRKNDPVIKEFHSKK
jgi:hypothetical protein